MAVKKKLSRKRKSDDMVMSEDYSSDMTPTSSVSPKKSRFWKIAIIVVLLAVVGALLARRYGNVLVVATVNGMPITRWTLTQRLTDRFGTQMVEALIGEQLILAEAKKQNVSVTEEEVNAKIAEIEKSLGASITLEESLKIQGLTKDEFVNQIRLQLSVDKMLAREVSVSATEVDEYLKTNQIQIIATQEAEQRASAEKEIKDNKVSEKFVEWFTKLKESAKIERYL